MTGQLVAACRAVGFQIVFDTNWGADLTITEVHLCVLDDDADGRKNTRKKEERK